MPRSVMREPCSTWVQGPGSYEPADRCVLAVEPSAAERAHRPPGAAPALDATAEALPFDDGAFDACMATMTVHQWADAERGIAELRRVARSRVVVLTFDADAFARFWLLSYIPELDRIDRGRLKTNPDRILELLGGHGSIEVVQVPRDCTDGFMEAYYARPEAFADPAVRAGQSGWKFLEPAVTDGALTRLAGDLASGAWDARFGHLRAQPTYASSLRLVVAEVR